MLVTGLQDEEKKVWGKFPLSGAGALNQIQCLHQMIAFEAQ